LIGFEQLEHGFLASIYKTRPGVLHTQPMDHFFPDDVLYPDTWRAFFG
jgi:hypothetical protein